MGFEQTFPNPYDQNSVDQQPEKLPLDEIIRQAMRAHTLGMRVCLPCSVTAVKGNQKVDLRPLLKTRYRNGDVVTLPQIQNVMVSMPMGAGYSIKLPVAVGDTGWAIFCDRSLDAWVASSGGVVDPQDSRQHDISDPIFVPGLPPFSMQTTDTTTDLVITNGALKARFQKSGTFVVTNGQNELLDILDKITAQIQNIAATLGTDTTNTVFGPTPLNSFETYVQAGETLAQLKEQLDTLKGS